MILKKKGVLDSTVLKMVSRVLKETTPTRKGFKVKTLRGEAVVTHEELIQFVDKLAEEIQQGNYDKLRKCETCGNFGYPGRKGAKGWCSPKDYSSFRKPEDYCSQWIPMTEQQKHTRRVLRGESGTLQTERAGNGSKDSKKGN